MSKQLSIVVTARTTGSRHEVFRLQADSSTWSRWTPFTEVTLIEQAPGGGEGVGAVKQTRFRGMTGRERIVSLTPDGHFLRLHQGRLHALYPRLRGRRGPT